MTRISEKLFTVLCGFMLILVSLGVGGPASASELRLVVFGDMPYGASPDTERRYQALLGAINARHPDLVIHIGDTKSGGTLCTDQALARLKPELERFDAPVIYTPGDNEWTDCHRAAAGAYDPIERLRRLRQIYFNGRTHSFGHPGLPLVTQAHEGYPENVRLRLGRTMIITAHVVGSNNNLRYTRDSDREFLRREAATLRWLRESFAAAASADQIVLALHANMFFLDFVPGLESQLLRTGHSRIVNELVRQARAFGKPVLLLHGDTHRFQVYKPLPRRAPNITAIETFGGSDIAAVEVSIGQGTEGRYRLTPIKSAP